jgi:NAD(P)-dependent dehydrogenase (short-subunit alcohol dehydrogenase family)
MAVNPMIIMTSRGEAAVKRMYGDDPGAGAQHIPVRRFSTPQDIANVISFLACDGSGYLSGEVIRVTGGTIQLNMK